MDLEEIRQQTKTAIDGLLEAAALKPGQILVLGCSTSEIAGKRIGTATNSEIAKAVLEQIMCATTLHGVYLAVQCCEHLNRALVIEQDAVDRYGFDEVTVFPVANAGGAAAGTAMHMFRRPVVVESVRAQAGIDIGHTLIGMHLEPVAVPVRIGIKKIGSADLVLARRRPRLVGGARAVYSPDRTEERYGKTVVCEEEQGI